MREQEEFGATSAVGARAQGEAGNSVGVVTEEVTRIAFHVGEVYARFATEKAPSWE